MYKRQVVYSPDVFRISALPDESIREILPYGACNPGNDAFPKELFTAQVVLTCTPFDPNNHTEKMNAAFLENQDKYAPFEIAAEFDMGNGYTCLLYTSSRFWSVFRMKFSNGRADRTVCCPASCPSRGCGCSG